MIDTAALISRYHTLAELTFSETAAARGIDNTPNEEALANLRRLAHGLDSVRDLLGRTLCISSAYRSPALNAAVRGVPGSQHSLGLAADFTCDDFGPSITIARAIHASDIVFDQCILEYGRWIHLSFSDTPRRRAMTIYDARAGYLDGIWDETGTRVA